MTPAEAAAALATVSAFDRRTVTEDDARAWAAALPWVDLAEAREAIVAHYGQSRDWIMPADIARRVRAARSARLLAMTPLDLPPALADRHRDEQRWVRLVRQRVAAGWPQDEAVADACRALDVAAPQAIATPADPGRLRRMLEGRADG